MGQARVALLVVGQRRLTLTLRMSTIGGGIGCGTCAPRADLSVYDVPLLLVDGDR